MKKLFLFCAALFALSAQAEEITLNLYTAVNANGEGVEYNTENIMDSTYSEDYTWSPFFYTNDFDFTFSHLPSGNSSWGTSWEGFTLSKKNYSRPASTRRCIGIKCSIDRYDVSTTHLLRIG